MAQTRGVVTEQEYPYRGYQSRCQSNGGNYRVSEFYNVRGFENMRYQLVNRGPMVGSRKI